MHDRRSRAPTSVAEVEGGVCAPRGFRAAGVNAGLAPGPGPDLALLASQQAATAAGRFTSHRFPSAPVRWTSARIAASGQARAVLAHAGSANAATGAQGDADAEALARRCAEAIGWAEGEVRIGGVAKASAPFSPSFATTLVLLTTDATVEPPLLDTLLGRAVGRSFERVLVDQGPGMGDAAIVLANATAAAPALVEGSDGAAAFEAALAYLCESLAEQLAMRVPGARKLVVVTVHGASSH